MQNVAVMRWAGGAALAMPLSAGRLASGALFTASPVFPLSNSSTKTPEHPPHLVSKRLQKVVDIQALSPASEDRGGSKTCSRSFEGSGQLLRKERKMFLPSRGARENATATKGAKISTQTWREIPGRDSCLRDGKRSSLPRSGSAWLRRPRWQGRKGGRGR